MFSSSITLSRQNADGLLTEVYRPFSALASETRLPLFIQRNLKALESVCQSYDMGFSPNFVVEDEKQKVLAKFKVKLDLGDLFRDLLKDHQNKQACITAIQFTWQRWSRFANIAIEALFQQLERLDQMTKLANQLRVYGGRCQDLTIKNKLDQALNAFFSLIQDEKMFVANALFGRIHFAHKYDLRDCKKKSNPPYEYSLVVGTFYKLYRLKLIDSTVWESLSDYLTSPINEEMMLRAKNYIELYADKAQSCLAIPDGERLSEHPTYCDGIEIVDMAVADLGERCFFPAREGFVADLRAQIRMNLSINLNKSNNPQAHYQRCNELYNINPTVDGIVSAANQAYEETVFKYLNAGYKQDDLGRLSSNMQTKFKQKSKITDSFLYRPSLLTLLENENKRIKTESFQFFTSERKTIKKMTAIGNYLIKLKNPEADIHVLLLEMLSEKHLMQSRGMMTSKLRVRLEEFARMHFPQVYAEYCKQMQQKYKDESPIDVSRFIRC